MNSTARVKIYDKIGANVLALKMKVEYVNRLFIQHDYSFSFSFFILFCISLSFLSFMLSIAHSNGFKRRDDGVAVAARRMPTKTLWFRMV